MPSKQKTETKNRKQITCLLHSNAAVLSKQKSMRQALLLFKDHKYKNVDTSKNWKFSNYCRFSVDKFQLWECFGTNTCIYLFFKICIFLAKACEETWFITDENRILLCLMQKIQVTVNLTPPHWNLQIKSLDSCIFGLCHFSTYILTSTILHVFSCPGSSIPTLGRQWLTATLEFGHKEWLKRLKTCQTFEQRDVHTKRQTDKKTKRHKEKK